VNQAPFHSDAHVTVGRWFGTYLVPANYAAPQDLQQRLDRVVAERLAEDCSSCLEQFLKSDDPAVWRIRNLAVNVFLEAPRFDPDDIARNWGRRLAANIHSIVEQAEQSDAVLRFQNKAAFVAQFVFDLAERRAWTKWYYEEFEDLRVLSDSQAIRAVLLRGDPLPVGVILQLASAARLEPVLLALNDGDARAIYDSCFDSAAVAPRDRGLEKWTGIVLELWNVAPLHAVSRNENHFRDALRLLGRTLLRFPVAQGDCRLKIVIDGLLELRRILSAVRSAPLLDSMIKNLAYSNYQTALDLAISAGASDPSAALAFFADRMQGDADWGAQAAAVVLGDSHQVRFLTSKTISEGESFLSSFGGIFLLGPTFQALRLDELSKAAAEPSQSREKIAAILRHLAEVKSLGRIRFAECADDPALRLFSGFEGHFFRQALEDLDAHKLDLAGAHRVLLQTFVDRHEARAPCLFANLVSLPAGHVAYILRDLAHDEWLDLAPVSATGSGVESLVQASLARFSHICGIQCQTLFIGESLASLVDSRRLSNAADRVAVFPPGDASIPAALAEQLGLTREQLASRISASEKDYPYFCFSSIWPDFELAPVLDCTLSLIARAALRHFARNLFGFEASSPEYLFQNFLSGLSAIRSIDQRLEVRLPASPLSLILRMAGLQEQKYVPSWLKGSEVWLLPPQE
jgi:hypothetical protein